MDLESAIAALKAQGYTITKPKARKSMSAEQFFDAMQSARKSVCAMHGDRWVVLGHAHWATVPAGWRSFTGPRGGKVKIPKDVRVPSAEFWPAGAIPAELLMAPATPATLTPWVVHTPGDDVAPYLMHPLIKLTHEAHAEARFAERALKHLHERIAA